METSSTLFLYKGVVDYLCWDWASHWASSVDCIYNKDDAEGSLAAPKPHREADVCSSSSTAAVLLTAMP